ncbi:hypothetical protein [Streptomyces sp. NPDC017435]|uniref:hypothetical protein n=1 Tax=Streptomyces sp. NPDC017435 TaxID=3364995 RepID=UPI0037BA9D53
MLIPASIYAAAPSSVIVETSQLVETGSPRLPVLAAQGWVMACVIGEVSMSLRRTLGKISLGGSRAGSYAACLAEDGADRQLVFCPHGAGDAVRLGRIVSSVADTPYGKTQTAMLTVGQPYSLKLLVAGLVVVNRGCRG